MKRAALSWPLVLFAFAVPELLAQVRPGAPAAPTSDAATKGTGMITGRVVDASSGAPVAEAVVTMNGRGTGPPARGPNVSRQLTGADGRFVFHDLAPGSYVFTATAPGYLTGGGPDSTTQPLTQQVTITLADAERRSDVRVRLWKSAVISGAVVDDAGEPAVGVFVQVLRRVMTGGRPGYSFGAIGRTDDRGMYRIASIAPGDYFVGIVQIPTTIPASTVNSMMEGIASGFGGAGGLFDLAVSEGSSGAMGGIRIGDHLLSSSSGSQPVLAGDGRLLVHQTLFYTAATTAAQATAVKLGSGEERSGVDFQLRLVPTARIAGTVVGPAGPAGGVYVRLVSSDDDPVGDFDMNAAAMTTAAADGSFVFLGVPAGRYVARVLKQPRPDLPAELASSPMGQFAFGAFGKPSAQDALTLFGETAVAVDANDVTGVLVTLSEGFKVSGRVQFEGSAPRPSPQQLQSVIVMLESVDGRTQEAMFGRAPRVGELGQFKTQGHPPGKYFVATSPIGGPVVWQLKSATAGGRDLFNTPVELKDSDVGDVVLTYTDRVSQIAGAVRSAAGTNSPNAMVVIFPADYRAWIANGMNARRVRTARANPTGAFTMGGLIAGDYLVAALYEDEPSDMQDPAVVEAIARVATRVTLGEAEKRSLDLQTAKVVR